MRLGEEIWAAFRSDAERANVKNAIISANEPRQGFIITTNRWRNFVFKRSADGSWSRIDAAADAGVPPARPAAPMDQREAASGLPSKGPSAFANGGET